MERGALGEFAEALSGCARGPVGSTSPEGVRCGSRRNGEHTDPPAPPRRPRPARRAGRTPIIPLAAQAGYGHKKQKCPPSRHRS